MNSTKAYPEAEYYLRDIANLEKSLELAYSVNTPEAAQHLLGLDGMPVGRDVRSSILLSRAVRYYVGRDAHLAEVVGPLARAQGLCSLLHLAVTNGYINIVRLLLMWGVDPSDSNELQRSALHMAAARGNHRIACILLCHGADPKAVHCSGKTALHFACESGNDDDFLVDYLLNRGLDINQVDRPHRNTPLHLAVSHRKTNLVRLLLRRGADLTARNTNGSTPVHLASWDLPMLEILLEEDADLERTDAWGHTPLQAIFPEMIEEGRIMISHLVLKEAVTGISVGKENAACMELQPVWRGLRDECMLEIEKMRKEEFYPGMSFFKVCCMSGTELWKHIKGSRIRRRLPSITLNMKFEERFVNYGKKIRQKFFNAFEARKHEHRVTNFVNRALGDRLPQEVTEKIGEYLKPADVRFNSDYGRD